MVRAIMLFVAAIALGACGGTVSAANAPADPLDACLATHSLSTPEVAASPVAGTRPAISTRAFRGCNFPAPDGAASDGYWQIDSTTYAWAGHPEVTGASAPDRFQTSCKRLELTYTFKDQGPASDLAPLIVSSGTVEKVNGKPWTGEPLPFATDPGDVVIVHNLSYTISRARCIA